MSDLAALSRQLELYAREELDLQKSTLQVLQEQQHALFHGDLAAMRASQERIDVRLADTAARASRRHDLVRRLAAHFGVDPSALTLLSICARLGEHGKGLATIAGELRETAQAVARATRRLGALARMHARLNDDFLATVLADRGVDRKDMARCGALIDARV